MSPVVKKVKKRPRRGSIMDGSDTPVRGPVHNRIHVAQHYQLDMGHPDIAANLVRELMPWAQRAVLGTVPQKPSPVRSFRRNAAPEAPPRVLETV